MAISNSKKRENNPQNGSGSDAVTKPVKRQKIEKHPDSSSEPTSRPKSKKELRKERKAALKAKEEADGAFATSIESAANNSSLTKHEDALLQTKERRREELRLERKAKKEAREQALEARFREQDRLRQEKLEAAAVSSPGNSKIRKHKSVKSKHEKKTAKKENKHDGQKDVDDYTSVYKSIFKKSQDPATGATTCRLGVQYIDVKEGAGPAVGNKSLVTVKYQLRGGSPHGVLLDKSKKFTFRVGKGEVIQGWDIGLEGMKQGGVRHLIVPPKAGYGSQDIGAGSGAVLHFDITLLEVR